MYTVESTSDYVLSYMMDAQPLVRRASKAAPRQLSRSVLFLKFRSDLYIADPLRSSALRRFRKADITLNLVQCDQ